MSAKDIDFSDFVEVIINLHYNQWEILIRVFSAKRYFYVFDGLKINLRGKENNSNGNFTLILIINNIMVFSNASR